MWTASLKISHRHSTSIPYAKRHNIELLAFPMSHYEKGDYFYLTTGHLVLGSRGDKEAYYTEVAKNPRIRDIERSGDFLIYTLRARKGETHLQMYIRPRIFFLKPIRIRPDGFQYLEVGALEKKDLTEFIREIEEHVFVHTKSVKQERVQDFYLPHVMPKITDRQFSAIMLAYEHGYYRHPKKTNIAKLAKIAGQGQSTYQEHLRKAEEKLIPFILENFSRK